MMLTFDNVTTATLGATVFRIDTDSAQPREYEQLAALGRDGVELRDKNHIPNDVMRYTFVFYGQTAESNSVACKNFLLSRIGYKRLEDTEHSSEYYKAYVSNVIAPKLTSDRGLVKYEVEFSRLPQRFLKTGETALTLNDSGSITNPTYNPAWPLLRVYGDGVLTINGDTIAISGSDVYTDIDFESGECFKGSVDKNSTVTLSTPDFVPLVHGANTFTFGTGITKVEITPRWWVR